MSRYRTVLFDCDSTLTALEGIDRLGADRPELAALTAAAMSGRMALEDVYRERLELVRPGRDAVARLAADYMTHAVEDAGAVIAALSRAGVDVRVVSGGLLSAVARFAAGLGLAPDAVHAVDVHFDEDGRYAGFDEATPLARSRGKETLVRELAPGLARPILFVGDGVTDLEAAPAVDLFVAYAGVVDRPAVSGAAPVVIRSASLAPVLPLVLDGSEVAPEDRALHAKGTRLLATDVIDRRR
ncbi:MAG TPA: HAD-IB family phosphatase [Longimicrobiales bacterium]